MSDEAENRPEMAPDTAEQKVDRGMTLAARMDMDGALAEFVAVENALRFSADPAARVQWARSLNGLGFIELMDAKEARAAVTDLDREAARAFRWGLKQALARFEQALAVQLDPRLRSHAVGHKAYTLALLGRADEARALFTKLFSDAGREAYAGQVKDTERHPIPEDRAIRRLIDEGWREAGGA